MTEPLLLRTSPREDTIEFLQRFARFYQPLPAADDVRDLPDFPTLGLGVC